MLACLVLAGCMFRLVYPRLDTIAVWQLDRMLRLDRQQERWLSARLEERLSWHRRHELPRWRDWLQAVRDDVAAGRMDAERHAEHRRRLDELFQHTAAGFVDVLVTLAARLDDRQVARFFERYDERTEELEEELADTSTGEWLEVRREEAEEQAEKWLGRLTPEQQAILGEWTRETPDWRPQTIETRRRWRAALAESLAARADPARLRAATERMLREPESLHSPAYREIVEAHEARIRALHLKLLETSGDDQRRHLVEKIQGWLDDVAALCAAD
jgi:hypothetical protein